MISGVLNSKLCFVGGTLVKTKQGLKAIESITCTPSHSILTDSGWKLASELTTNDKVKTLDGFVQIKSIEIEQLNEKAKVYNLNVLGYHTYVVGSTLLVVHNACNSNGRKGCQAHQDKIDEIYK